MSSRDQKADLDRQVARLSTWAAQADLPVVRVEAEVGGQRLVRWRRVTALRPIAGPFVAAAPGGARVRARLRVSEQDEAVLWAAGMHLGSLAGRDLAARCAEGRLDAKGRAGSRARRKKALTAESSSRWAGAITRTSDDQVRLAGQNLRAEGNTVRARIRRIEARLPVPAGGRAGRARGYATPGRAARQNRAAPDAARQAGQGGPAA